MEKNIINVSGFNHSSIVDGPGMRFVIFTQGCSHKCQGCHNKSTWSSRENNIMTIEEIICKIKEESFSKNVTISGGDPLLQSENIIKLCKELKKDNYNIWLYTGYTLEEIKKNDKLKEILTIIDVLVDGKYDEDLKDYTLQYRGSSNQKIHYLS